jgi:hypothetical protein
VLPRGAGLLLACLAAMSPGCETERTTRSTLVAARVPAPLAAPRPGEPYAGVRVLGSVPYDGRTLPLVSPDGFFVATQVGAAAAWDALLGVPGARSIPPCAVEIYRCDPRGEVAVLQARTETGLLLGRSADEAGLLVESPHDDGARWIGRLPWVGGPVQWLVADDRVNAFACLGPQGRLAWSRRRPDAENFDLVVRLGNDEWSLEANGGDWLMPAWSKDPDGLFVLRLAGGRLDAVFMNASSADAARQTLARLPIAQQKTARDAYQCLSSRAHVQGLPALGSVHLLFWHPGALRMAVWRPFDSADASTLLEPGSVAAEVDGSGFILTTTADRLFLQDPSRGATRTLLPGPLVPRPTADPRWPYVLLLPQHGRIGLMALRLEPGQ